MSSARSPVANLSRPRQPGQHLSHEKLPHLIFDAAATFGIALMLLALAASEWLRYFFQIPPKPITFSIVIVPAIAIAAWRLIVIYGRLENTVKGEAAERAVGALLDDLRKDGYTPFHDIPTPRGNIDHALIGPAGVFAIETKYVSKPDGKRKADISYDGSRLMIGGRNHSRDLEQAQAVATNLREIVRSSTGLTGIDVMPILAYPGWMVSGNTPAHKVQVINPKQIFEVRGWRRLLSDDQVSQITHHLRLHVKHVEERALE